MGTVFHKSCRQMVGKVHWGNTVIRETQLIALLSEPIGSPRSVTGSSSLPSVPSSILNSSQIMDKNQSFKRSANRRKLTLANGSGFVFSPRHQKKNSLYHRSDAKLSRTPSKFYWMLKPRIFLFSFFFGSRVRSANVKSMKQVVVLLVLLLSISISPLTISPSFPPSLHRFLSH